MNSLSCAKDKAFDQAAILNVALVDTAIEVSIGRIVSSAAA
jgi:hypothetical protein